jgi:hypothetical protein
MKEVNIMFFTAKEMLLLCAFHSGTRSKTLDLLRSAKGDDPERIAAIKSVTAKLESMNGGDTVSLHFDPES